MALTQLIKLRTEKARKVVLLNKRREKYADSERSQFKRKN